MKKFSLFFLVTAIPFSAFPSEKGGNRNSGDIRVILEGYSRNLSCPVFEDEYAIDDVCAEVEADVGLLPGKELEKKFLRDCCGVRK